MSLLQKTCLTASNAHWGSEINSRIQMCRVLRAWGGCGAHFVFPLIVRNPRDSWAPFTGPWRSPTGHPKVHRHRPAVPHGRLGSRFGIGGSGGQSCSSWGSFVGCVTPGMIESWVVRLPFSCCSRPTKSLQEIPKMNRSSGTSFTMPSLTSLVQ